MGKKTNIILITGFLGSGKTTFLNNVMRQIKDHTIDIIVNDFGEIVVDTDIIKQENESITDSKLRIEELGNGSIFCSCLKPDLVNALVKYSKKTADFLVIETSGLSDPSSFYVLLRESKELGDYYSVSHSFCLIDSPKFLHLIQHMDILERQIRSCTNIILNKVDLVDTKILGEIESLIKTFNSQAKIFKASYADFDFSQAQWNDPALKRQYTGASGCNPRLLTTSSLLPQIEITYDSLQRFLHQLEDEQIYRMKGYVSIGDNYFKIDGDPVQIEKVNGFIPSKLGISVICQKGYEREIESHWSQLKS